MGSTLYDEGGVKAIVTPIISFLLYVRFFSVGDTFEENIKRHEAFLALKLRLKKGEKVLVSIPKLDDYFFKSVADLC
jgi:hypothetical protein